MKKYTSINYDNAECKSCENVVPISYELIDECKNLDSMNRNKMNF